MGGSDQWGNIVTGTELIRRKDGGDAYALTTPLLTKSDGSKFGKSEDGNLWLDKTKTSAYKFYQYWLNLSDEDAEKYIKVFTFLAEDEIKKITTEHHTAPHLRLLQKTLAREITILVHSQADYETALDASEILFGKGTTESLRKLSEDDFLAIFNGVPVFEVARSKFSENVPVIDFLTDLAPIFESKGELKRMITGGGLSVNKDKIMQSDQVVDESYLINSKYLLAQKGKKNYYIVKAV